MTTDLFFSELTSLSSFPYIAFLRYPPFFKAYMLRVDVLNFPRQVHCGIRLNLAHALILVQVGLPCSDSRNENRLSSYCHVTAMYAYVCTKSSRIMYLHICYVLFKHTDSHQASTQASKCNKEQQANPHLG